MGRTRKKAVQAIVEHLARIGQEIVDKQLGDIGYTHRTYNLHDSYGWCVYVDGKPHLMGFEGSAMATEVKKWKGRELSGRDEIKRLFESGYKPSAPIELAVAVAMPYGMVLEEKMKYRVFATAASDVQQAARRIQHARYEYIRK